MNDTQKFYTESRFISKPALIIGVVTLIITAAGFFVDRQQFFFSYLVAFAFWATVTLGGLFFTLIHNTTHAMWSTVLRRIIETIMMTVPVMAILAIPVLFGIHDLYHWSHEDAVAADALLQKKAAYLNIPFFVIRTIFYFAVWMVLSFYLYRISKQQDKSFDPEQKEKLRKRSAPSILIFALTLTFASFDWLMSLDPHWYSTIFGVYIFAGSFLSAIAFVVLVLISLHKRNILTDVITVEHYHDLGKFLFSFTVFWGYMAFSQYFLIWYANIPEETIWFAHRWEGSWKYITLLLVFGHFVVPFLALMPRAAKRNLKFMRIISIWILLMHFFDLYWLVIPTLHKHGFYFSWMDLTAMIGIGGIFVWYFWQSYLKGALVPVNDTKLAESIKLVN
jgi:hypothetical protein